MTNPGTTRLKYLIISTGHFKGQINKKEKKLKS